MSSPLSMLKKTKRIPLQVPADEQRSKQKVPFRRNLVKEFHTALVSNDSSDPNDLLPSQTPANEASTSKSKAPIKKAAPSDFELMTTMAQRVIQLEKIVKSQTQEIECKDKRISALEEKLRLQEESGRNDVKQRCQQLQNQVNEMEKFLGDYGLVWVGDQEDRDAAEHEETHSPGTSVGSSFYMNFDLVLQRIRDLNILSGEGESFVQTTAIGAQLAKKDPVQLRLYSNGIVMFDGPFRSYQEHSTQQCMQDLMDGYFPSELSERFPDGVPFEVHDRRDEEFVFRLPWEAFSGEGQTVCGMKAEAASSQLPGKKLTTDQFLNKLPKCVVKGGRVIDVRDSVRATLQGSSADPESSSMILIDTPALQAMTDRPQTSSAVRLPSAHGVITLKLRSEDGNHTYIVKMYSTETVGHLRTYLDQHRGTGLPAYDIISVHPQRCYDDNGQTLCSCGVTTNANLLLRKRRRGDPVAEDNKPVEG
ncbi:UBX domain-containing protein 11 isoform X2 [Acanthochromis polyacanthus]|uniref:UBX domain-containing protein 11 isoform X2 n=1 Tax=Acanthochromis polyacanthus TaxID=80966 RepID=UPI0022349B83|nr:UBX domain-containing protein 11 isoform X2 [Acanthochromis polyacanthus]